MSLDNSHGVNTFLLCEKCNQQYFKGAFCPECKSRLVLVNNIKFKRGRYGKK